MAEMGSVSATVKDYKGKCATVRVEVSGPTAAKAKKLAEYLKDHSDAAVQTYGLSIDYTGDETDSGKYDRVLHKLVYLYKDDDKRSRRFSVPAPRDEDVNDDQEPDSDTAEDVKDLLVSLGAFKSAEYNGGGLDSRLPSSEARARATTGV